MAENEIKKTGHSYSEVMRAIDKLPEEEKTELLEFLKLNEITYLMDNAESVTAYCNDLIAYTNKLIAVAKALPKVYKMVNAPTDAVDDIVCEYDKLDEDKKKETALKLMNNGAFQKDCCEILVGDVERLVNENPTLKAIDNSFNIIGWYKKNIERGIGMNHKYGV